MMIIMNISEQKISSHVDIGLYLDFYGQLLTEHAREILEMHFAEDMSLSEIAENLGITRQAVHDRIRQGTSQLSGYEEALGLARRFRVTRECVRAAVQALDSGETELAKEMLRRLEIEL
jgi:uncharacterized protein